MVRICLLIFLSITFSSIWSQNEGNIWYFGSHVGLDFNYDPPTPIEDSETACTGCSSICDSAGNLLFYTNGHRNFDRNHNELITPDEIGGYNHNTQSPLIIKKPDSDHLYYLFKMSTAWVISQDLKYSVIDMNLNGGLGDVSDLKGVELVDSVSDKITGIRHANGRDAWIITHSLTGNAFYAFLLTPDGVDPEPITSEVGIYIDNSEWDHRVNGQLQSSVQGDRIAMATRYNDFQILDFDNSTGVISNPTIIPNPAEPYEWGPYGCEFSPSGNLLYVTLPNFFPLYSLLLQYDLTAEDIPASEIIIANEGVWWGQMTIGPDNKIYFPTDGENYMSIIHNPDVPGLECNLETYGILLIGSPEILTHSGRGVPNHINTLYKEFVGTKEYPLPSSTFSIYPTPYENGQIVNFTPDLLGMNTLTIYNIDGKQVYRKEDVSGSSTLITEIKFATGVYLIEIKNANKEQILLEKFIVE